MLDRLGDLGPARAEGQTEYLLALAVFVEKYERAHEPIPAATGVEMLGYLIETHGVKQGEVAAGTGLADSTVSEILAGKRKMNVKHIEALARSSRSSRPCSSTSGRIGRAVAARALERRARWVGRRAPRPGPAGGRARGRETEWQGPLSICAPSRSSCLRRSSWR